MSGGDVGVDLDGFVDDRKQMEESMSQSSLAEQNQKQKKFREGSSLEVFVKSPAYVV